MGNLENKNTVQSKNQVGNYVFFEGEKSSGLRIMFIGNSITWHGPAPNIGWYGDWGMAASAREKDYVHLIMKYIKEKYSDACLCVIQAAEWERTYKVCKLDDLFLEAKGFMPDIIITRLSENISVEDFDCDLFIEKMDELHKYFSCGKDNVKIIVTSNVFNNQIKDAALRKYTERFVAEYVYIDDYCKNEKNKALEFEHEGVRLHPGDKGMRFIADRIIETLDSIIK